MRGSGWIVRVIRVDEKVGDWVGSSAGVEVIRLDEKREGWMEDLEGGSVTSSIGGVIEVREERED